MARELSQQLLQHGLGVPHNAHLDAPIGANLLRLDVDMNDFGVSRELPPEAKHPVQPRSYDQDDIGIAHHGAACGAEVQRMVVGNEATAHG